MVHVEQAPSLLAVTLFENLTLGATKKLAKIARVFKICSMQTTVGAALSVMRLGRLFVPGGWPSFPQHGLTETVLFSACVCLTHNLHTPLTTRPTCPTGSCRGHGRRPSRTQ